MGRFCCRRRRGRARRLRDRGLRHVRGVRAGQHGRVGAAVRRFLRVRVRQVHAGRQGGRRPDVADHVQRGERRAGEQGAPDAGDGRRGRGAAARDRGQAAVRRVRGRAARQRPRPRPAAGPDRRGRRLAAAPGRPVGLRAVPVDRRRVPVPRAGPERRLSGRPVRQGEPPEHVRARRRTGPGRAGAQPGVPEARARRQNGGQLLQVHGGHSGRARRPQGPGPRRTAAVPRV